MSQNSLDSFNEENKENKELSKKQINFEEDTLKNINIKEEGNKKGDKESINEYQKIPELSNIISNSKEIVKERNIGIDLLRIIAMYMIVILHVLGQGGILSNSKKFSSSFYLGWLLETFAYCSVNVFGLISGYVMINSNVNQYKIILLWLNVFYYSTIITLMFKYIPYFSKLYQVTTYYLIISIFFPTISKRYWYFTAYFGMYFFIPYLNKLIHSLNQKEMKNLCLTIIILFTILDLIAPEKFDPFSISRGYTTLWLISLYIFGAYLKLYSIQLSKKKILLLYIISIIFPWIFLLKFLNVFVSKYKYNAGLFIQFNSPFILLNAIMLVTIFSELKIKKNKFLQKFIGILGLQSFNVYLIHTNPLVYKSYKYSFKHLINKNPFIMDLLVLVYSLGIFFSCIIIDQIRFHLFNILKVHVIPNKIKNIIHKYIIRK